MRVFELPEGSRTAKGQAIINLLNIEQGEMVQAVLTVNKDLIGDKGHFITMATANGMIKKTPLSEYSNIRGSGKIGISLRDGDQLIKVEISHGKNYLILVTKGGKSIKFKETDVTATGRDTMGVKGMTLKSDDAVIAMETVEIDPPKPDDKRTDVGEYPEQKRGGQGVKVAELSDRTGDIAAVRMVTEDDEQVVITTKQAQVIKLPLKNIKVLGRSTQGVILMRPATGDVVTSVTTLQEAEEEEV